MLFSKFNGTFTPRTRHFFIKKRKALHLTQERLADLLGCSREAISSWEVGRVTQCHPNLVIPVGDFLLGKMDAALTHEKDVQDYLNYFTRRAPAPVRKLFSLATQIIKHQDEAKMLLQRLNDLCKRRQQKKGK